MRLKPINMSSEENTTQKKSGIAVLVGRSNSGKSTLMNSLVGTKVAITTPKPQTTRHTIQGVVNDDRGQIVFVDTPGIFTRVPDHLTAKLNERAIDALTEVDVVVYVVDPTRHVAEEEERVHRLVKNSKAPKVLVLNKSDLNPEYIDEYLSWKDEFVAIIKVSALQEKNLKALVQTILDELPRGEPLSPHASFTDKSAEFRLEELIREKLFLSLHQEVPYTTTVKIDELERRDNGLLYINARVITTSPRYRKMIIGSGAKKIKHVGQSVRKELELVTNGKVYIALEVVVEENWQERFI